MSIRENSRDGSVKCFCIWARCSFDCLCVWFWIIARGVQPAHPPLASRLCQQRESRRSCSLNRFWLLSLPSPEKSRKMLTLHCHYNKIEFMIKIESLWESIRFVGRPMSRTAKATCRSNAAWKNRNWRDPERHGWPQSDEIKTKAPSLTMCWLYYR